MRGAEGVTTGGPHRSAEETAAARSAIAAEGVEAANQWSQRAARCEWDHIRMPLTCYRFGTPVSGDPVPVRRTKTHCSASSAFWIPLALPSSTCPRTISLH